MVRGSVCRSHEQRLHGVLLGDPLHRLVRWPLAEAVSSVEHLRQDHDIADRIQEHAGSAEDPVHGAVDGDLVS